MTAGSFCYHDPNSGRIARHEFVEFVEDFKRAAVAMGGAQDAMPFLRYSDVVVKRDKLPVPYGAGGRPSAPNCRVAR